MIIIPIIIFLNYKQNLLIQANYGVQNFKISNVAHTYLNFHQIHLY